MTPEQRRGFGKGRCMIYYGTVKRQLTQQEIDGNLEQLMLRAKRLGAQDMPITLRKDLTRPLTPREMDTNFQSLDLAVKKARYGDGPYPAAEYIFDGATVLPAGITFSRSGEATYIKNGKLLTAGVDEPVFERGGLRVWPSVTNLYPGNNSLVTDSSTQYGMDVSAAASIFEGKEAALYTTNGDRNNPYLYFLSGDFVDKTKRYTHSAV